MKFKIEKNNINKRLDVFLTDTITDTSRSYIKKLIDNNKVLVNDIKVKAGYLLKEDDLLVIDCNLESKEITIEPKQMNIHIIYEDDDVIVINKDKGVVVHPGNNNYTDTLVNGLLYSHSNNLSSDDLRPGIVHRIDKDTTGVLIVAKTEKAHRFLSEQFKEHTITRRYIGIVKGIVKDDNITIDKPIGRNPKDRLKMAVTNINSKHAITHIKVLKRYYESKLTLIEAKLETGRTHQIRVHMKYLGYPLLGDLTYGNEYKQIKVKGHMLHAKVLGFIHPTTNKYVEFSVEEPNEFKDIIKKLEAREN